PALPGFRNSRAMTRTFGGWCRPSVFSCARAVANPPIKRKRPNTKLVSLCINLLMIYASIRREGFLGVETNCTRQTNPTLKVWQSQTSGGVHRCAWSAGNDGAEAGLRPAGTGHPSPQKQKWNYISLD